MYILPKLEIGLYTLQEQKTINDKSKLQNGDLNKEKELKDDKKKMQV